jgi:long-chain acyl-CoA synthetase
MDKSSTATICHSVLEMPHRKSDAVAVSYKADAAWQELSWTQYYEAIATVASALLSYQVQPGDKIAIMSNTRVEWSVCDYAIMGIQAITVPIYQTVTAEDLQYMLNNSKSKILFLENRSMLKLFLKVQASCPSVEKVICFDSVRESDLQVTGWDELLAYGTQEKPDQKAEFEKLSQATRPGHIATLIYTSGTSGTPKGVVLTHEQILSEISEAFPFLGVTTDDVSLTFLPYAHVLGRIEHWGHVYVGFHMAFAESIERIKYNLTEIRPTILISVPRIFEKVYSSIFAQLGNSFLRNRIFKWALSVGYQVGELRLQRKSIPVQLFAQYELAQRLVLHKVKDAFGGRLRFSMSGGAPISKEIALFFHACDVLILEGYGLTETTAAVCANTPYNYHFGSVGRPIGDVQIRIADDGEILLKSKKIMREYYEAPELTKEVFTDGWFHTGDIGQVLPSGDLQITDRKKDLIKTGGGKYVAPQKLENLLKLNSFISNVLIHGDQKKYIVALITLDPLFMEKFAKEKNIAYSDYASLTQHPVVLEMVRKGVAQSNTQLAAYETVKRFAVLPQDFTVESGELTPSLKVKRKVLDQKFQKQLTALYS